jgi:periplasmic divalent cation tolerance protein
VRSIYRWEGKVCDEQEALLVLKAPAKCFQELRARILALHPYQLPEVIALRIEDGHEKYIDWIVQSMY